MDGSGAYLSDTKFHSSNSTFPKFISCHITPQSFPFLGNHCKDKDKKLFFFMFLSAFRYPGGVDKVSLSRYLPTHTHTCSCPMPLPILFHPVCMYVYVWMNECIAQSSEEWMHGLA